MERTDIIKRGPVNLPLDSEIVTDADEEVFLLYSYLQTGSASGSVSDLGFFRGLGHVDSRRDTLTVKFDLRSTHLDTFSVVPIRNSRVKTGTRKRACEVAGDEIVEIELAQDTTALRTRKGDTGSVLWKASIDFCQLILQQHHANLEMSLLDNSLLKTSHVLELGAGTGLLSIALSPLVRRYTVTDVDVLLPLIRKNLQLNFDGWPTTQSGLPGSNVYAEALDWQTLESATPHFRSRCFSFEPIDLILVVDCIYHPTLLPPLVETLDFLATPCQTAVLVLVELRAEDVIREFMNLWISRKGWEIWRVGGGFLGIPYVMWLGWKLE